MIGLKKVLIFFAIVGFVASKSALDITEVHDNELKDSNFAQKLETASQTISSALENHEDYHKVGKIGKIVFAIFKRSIDVKCFEKKLEELEWSSKFNGLVSRSEELSDKEKIELSIMYSGVGAVCSNKLQPIEEFVFDFLMSLGHLVRAFKDEPELDKYFFFLRCLNKFAVDKKYWDFPDYQLNTKMTGFEAEMCGEFTEKFDEAIVERLKEGIKSADGENVELTECRRNSITDMVPFFVKYVLLTQVALTPEEKVTQKAKFIEAHRKLSDQSLKCVIDDKMTLDISKFTSLSAGGF